MEKNVLAGFFVWIARTLWTKGEPSFIMSPRATATLPISLLPLRLHLKQCHLLLLANYAEEASPMADQIPMESEDTHGTEEVIEDRGLPSFSLPMLAIAHPVTAGETAADWLKEACRDIKVATRFEVMKAFRISEMS
jgi:hypothetical protein